VADVISRAVIFTEKTRKEPKRPDKTQKDPRRPEKTAKKTRKDPKIH
jgi:hypothetical protein